MERPRPETHLFFDKEFNAMSLAVAEVDKLANNLKFLYEADVTRAMEENRALAEVNTSLCRRIELLRSSLPERSVLPNQIESEDARVVDGNTTEEKGVEASHSLQISKDNLRDTVVDGFTRDTVADGFKPPSPPPRCSQPPAPPFSCPSPPHIGSKGNAQFLAPEQLSKAESLVVRHVWLEAQGVMIETCQERLSFTIGKKQQRNAKLRRGKSLAMLARTYTRSSCIMHPVGGYRMFWNFLCLLAILYDLFWIPLQVFDITDLQFLQVCEWLLTIFWTTDVMMTFRTGYFVGSSVELRPRHIAFHYAKTWLGVDLIIVVLEWLGRFMNITSSASLLRSTRAARNVVSFVKLIRLAKMNQLWTAVQEQVNSNVFELSWTLIVLCLSMFAVVHVVACIWYAIGSMEDGWTSYDVEYEGDKNTFFWYIASARWVISQLNGRTDMHPRRTMVERLFTCIMGIALALIAQALFISIITKTMIDLSELVSDKTRRRRLVNDYLDVHPLTPALTSQVKRCLFEYTDPGSMAQTEDAVLSVLPNFLQTNVLYQVRAPVVMQHSFFHTLRYESPWAMRLVCRRVIQLVPVSKCEVIFDKGDVCNRMLFSDQLTLAYGNPDNKHSEQGQLGLSLSGLRRSKSRLASHPRSAPIESTTVLRISNSWRNNSNSTSAGSRNTPTSESASMSDLAFSWEANLVRAGEWVSEAALWTDWRNQGRLLAYATGVMIGAQADELANSLMKHPDAFAMASMYAAKFVEHLRRQDKLSDIINFEVMTFAPVLLNVTVISATALSMQNGQSGRFDSTSGVYCICKVMGLTGSSEARFTTSSVGDCPHPMWYHTSCVNISRHQSLIFEVWNDELIGTARLDPEDFLPSGFAGDKPLSVGNGDKQVFVGNGILTIKIEVGEVTDVEKVES